METRESLKIGDYVIATFSPSGMKYAGRITQFLEGVTGTRCSILLFIVKRREFVLEFSELTKITEAEAMLWMLEAS